MKTVTTEDIKVKQFIQTVLIGNIGDLVATGNHYLGFGTQTQGIELIGAIIEDENIEKLQKNPDSEFETRKKSRRRFHNALKLFSNSNYLKYCPEDNKQADANYDLYQNLRCGYAHQMKPTGKIFVTTEGESIKDGTNHLEIDTQTNNLIVVSEVLYRDFKQVCEIIISMIDNGQINHKKAYGNFFGINNYA